MYPLSSVRGVVPEKSIFKKQGDVVAKRYDVLIVENPEQLSVVDDCSGFLCCCCQFRKQK